MDDAACGPDPFDHGVVVFGDAPAVRRESLLKAQARDAVLLLGGHGEPQQRWRLVARRGVARVHVGGRTCLCPGVVEQGLGERVDAGVAVTVVSLDLRDLRVEHVQR